MNTDGDSELRRSSARKSLDCLSPRYLRVRSVKKKCVFFLLRWEFNEICFLCCPGIVVFAFFVLFCLFFFYLFCFPASLCTNLI